MNWNELHFLQVNRFFVGLRKHPHRDRLRARKKGFAFFEHEDDPDVGASVVPPCVCQGRRGEKRHKVRISLMFLKAPLQYTTKEPPF